MVDDIILDLLEQATNDSLIYCPECSEAMEADCEVCPDCGKENPLIAMGLI